MANPVSIPGDLIVPGDLRVSGNITPALTKSNILAEASLQAFTVPMSLWNDHGDHHYMTPGTGISRGTDTVYGGVVSRVGSLIKTEIFIDLDGLKDGGTTKDIIGVNGEKNCHIGQIRAAVNGTIVYGRITCLETPAGGDDDIDFYGTVTEATGQQDTLVTDLTGEVVFINSGDWSAAVATPEALTAMPGVGYMYMTGITGDQVEYTAGQFLLELWGTPATNTLKYVPGTHGTNAPSLQTDNFQNNHAAASYVARGEIQIPWEYIAAGSVTLRLHAGMLTTVASVACTLDLEVYKSDEDSTSTGDLVPSTTTAQDMNSDSFADFDFALTSTTLSPGDLLDVEITVSADDDGDAGAMTACIGSVQLLCDVR